MFTYGSFIASVIPQIFASLLLMALSIVPGVIFFRDILDYVDMCMFGLWLISSIIMLFIICTALLIIHVYLWISGPQGAFKCGVKDL